MWYLRSHESLRDRKMELSKERQVEGRGATVSINTSLPQETSLRVSTPHVDEMMKLY